MGYLFFFLLSFQTFAAENCQQNPSVLSEEMTKLTDVIALEWSSVSPTQFENAICKTRDVPDWDGYFATLPNEIKRNREMNGFQFRNETQTLIAAFRDIYPGRAPDLDSSCTTVLCAVDEIWGTPLGRKILYIRLRHGFNTSEFTRNRARRFNEIEMNEILLTLGDLPSELENLGRNGNQPMVLAAAEVVSSKNREALANAGITIYQTWRTSSSFFRQYSLYHEFAHNMARLGTKNHGKSKAWRQMAKDCPVSNYGNTSSDEDFAESALIYRYNGPGLIERCPAKYEYLKNNIYNGREFLSENNCSGTQAGP